MFGSPQGGICRARGVGRYILGFLSICGFVTTLSGGVCGCAAPPWEVGLPFGVVGDIHIRVCMSNPVGLGMFASSPHGSLLRAGRRSQVSFSRHLWLMICRSSRCLNQYMVHRPRFPCLCPATCKRGTALKIASCAVIPTGVIVECSRCVIVYNGIPITSLRLRKKIYGYEEKGGS
jgi:hypothetical protein